MKVEPSKLALVTGAGIRLGRSCAVKLAEAGYDVIIHFNSSKEQALQTKDLVEQTGRNGFLIQSDLSSAEGVEALVEQVGALSTKLELLVNNASIFFPSATPEKWIEHWDTFQMVNLKSPFMLTTLLLPWLRASNGNVVNIVDLWSRFPLRKFLPYSVAKAGLEALTKGLALELAPDIRVNGVSPGAALPPPNSDDSMDKMLSQVPLQRYGGGESIADAVAYLAQADYVTGQILLVDGGRSINL